MAFKPPPAILQKVMRFGLFKHNSDLGQLLFLNTPALVLPMESVCVLFKEMFDTIGYEKTVIAIYNMGKFQGNKGIKITSEKFGYAQTIKDKRRLLEFNTGQTDILGLGKFDWLETDFENNIFRGKGFSVFAEEYKKKYNLITHSIDFFLMGMCAGALEYLTGKEMIAVEDKCISKGNPECLFIAKEKSQCKKDDEIFGKFSFLF